MSDVTILLGAFVTILIVANVIVSLLPRKDKGIKVAFLPPSPVTPGNPGLESKMDAHISSTNQKISQLFSRMEGVEKKVEGLLHASAPAADKTWIETVPVRNTKPKK